jgi:hypothetical protein
MRGKGAGSRGIESVLRTTDDHAGDRILRTQFWLTPASPKGEVVALDSRRALSR